MSISLASLQAVINTADDKRIYPIVSQLGSQAKVLGYMTSRVAHDYRPATPRRLLRALRECAATGYPGRELMRHHFAQPTGCDSMTAASVNAVLA